MWADWTAGSKSETSTHGAWIYPAKNSEWGEHYPTCSSGEAQSPVNIVTTGIETARDNSMFSYDNKGAQVVKRTNNGKTLQLDFDETDGANKITIGTAGYVLWEVHFHMGSENFLMGVQKPLEVQFVHIDRSNAELGPNMAVYAEFLVPGDSPSPGADELVDASIQKVSRIFQNPPGQFQNPPGQHYIGFF